MSCHLAFLVSLGFEPHSDSLAFMLRGLIKDITQNRKLFSLLTGQSIFFQHEEIFIQLDELDEPPMHKLGSIYSPT